MYTQNLSCTNPYYNFFYMDLQTLYLSALFTFLFFFLVIPKIWKKPKKADSSLNLPPGPKKLPIIGNLHNLVGSNLPHVQLRDLATKYGPLMHLQLGEVSTIVISSPDYAKEVMKTHDHNFASRPHILATEILSYNSTNIAFAPYGDYWRQLRKICTVELLSMKRVQSFRPIREEEIGKTIKWIASQEGSVINLTQAIISLILTITSRAAFGKKCKDQDEFVSVLTEGISLGSGFNIGDLYPSSKLLQVISGLRPKLERLRHHTGRITENIINDHIEAKLIAEGRQDEAEEDFVDVLLKYEGSNDLDLQLTTNNIKAIILDIFGGGSETTTTTINWAFAEMIKDLRVMKNAQAEIRGVFDSKEKVDETCIAELKYLKAVVKETLRLHPPAPLLLPRECGQACEINGYHIPFKTKVIVNAWAIGRDPNYWNEPDRFCPERFMDSSIDYKGRNFEYIPFGAGRRICPGMTFGLINVELPLALLLYHFDWRLPSGMKNEDLDLAEDFGITVKRKYDQYLIPIPRRPLPDA